MTRREVGLVHRRSGKLLHTFCIPLELASEPSSLSSFLGLVWFCPIVFCWTTVYTDLCHSFFHSLGSIRQVIEIGTRSLAWRIRYHGLYERISSSLGGRLTKAHSFHQQSPLIPCYRERIRTRAFVDLVSVASSSLATDCGIETQIEPGLSGRSWDLLKESGTGFRFHPYLEHHPG